MVKTSTLLLVCVAKSLSRRPLRLRTADDLASSQSTTLTAPIPPSAAAHGEIYPLPHASRIVLAGDSIVTLENAYLHCLCCIGDTPRLSRPLHQMSLEPFRVKLIKVVAAEFLIHATFCYKCDSQSPTGYGPPRAALVCHLFVRPVV